MEQRGVFEPLRLVMSNLGASITSVALVGSQLMVGCEDGSLHVYEWSERSTTVEGGITQCILKHLKEEKRFHQERRRPIRHLTPVVSLKVLLSVGGTCLLQLEDPSSWSHVAAAEGTLYTHLLSDISQRNVVEEARGCTSIALSVGMSAPKH